MAIATNTKPTEMKPMFITASGSVLARVAAKAIAWVMGGMMEPMEAPITTRQQILCRGRFMEAKIPKVSIPITVEAATASPIKEPARQSTNRTDTARARGLL